MSRLMGRKSSKLDIGGAFSAGKSSSANNAQEREQAQPQASLDSSPLHSPSATFGSRSSPLFGGGPGAAEGSAGGGYSHEQRPKTGGGWQDMQQSGSPEPPTASTAGNSNGGGGGGSTHPTPVKKGRLSHAASLSSGSTSGPMSGSTFSQQWSEFGSGLPSLPQPPSGLPFDHGASSSSAATSGASSSSSSALGIPALRETLRRRISGFQYIKGTLSGKQLWMNTVRIYRKDLEAAFDAERTKKRSLRHMILGLSLSTLLEVNAPTDFCKAVLSLFAELDGFLEAVAERDRGKLRGLFRGAGGTLGGITGGGGGSSSSASKGASRLLLGRTDSAAQDMAISTALINDAALSYPNIPYALDFCQVLMTLCDMVVEVYAKLLLFLGPTSRASATGSTIGKGGGASARTQSVSSSAQQSESSGTNSSTQTTPLSPPTLELVLKVDAKFKKILAQITKEIDQLARHLIKDELTGLESVVKGAALSTLSSSGAPSPIAMGSFSTMGGNTIGTSTTTTNSVASTLLGSVRGHSSSASTSSSSGKNTASSFGFTPATTVSSHERSSTIGRN